MFALICVMVICSWTAFPRQAHADPISPTGMIALSNAGPVSFSPVTLADLNKDGRLDVLVGTSDGKVFAITYKQSAGQLSILWSHDLANDLGGPTSIRAAVSVGDLDNNGEVEVVVAAGDVGNYQGGVVALNGSTGSTRWTFKTLDFISTTGGTGPDGFSDGVVSTPALGDLNGDGKLEVVFGCWDFNIYVLDSEGKKAFGWPKFMRDTIWSSPAIADIDNDGLNEFIFGIDTHLEGTPFNTPDGGGLYVYHLDGTLLPSWPKFIGQTIYSSPAVGDLDGDGQLEIVHGTGDFYNNPIDGNKVYVWSSSGALRWTGTTGGYVRESPALADLNGDGKPDVIAAAKDFKVYAWKNDGTPIWQVAPTNVQGTNTGLVGGLPVAADYNNDGSPDVFINVGWDSTVLLGGTGAQLTANSFPNNPKPGYQGGYTTAVNAPAIGDITGDGKLDLVLAAADNSGKVGRVSFWSLTASATAANQPWPMFGQNSQHTRRYPTTHAFDAAVVSHSIPDFMQPGQKITIEVTLKNTGSSRWTNNVSVDAGSDRDAFATNTRNALNSSEVIAPGSAKTFQIAFQAPQTSGYYTTDWRMFDSASGQHFGLKASVKVKVGNQPGLQVLTTQGVYAVGLASNWSNPFYPPTFSTWSDAIASDSTADKRGYMMVDTNGTRWTGGSAMPVYPGGRRVLSDIALGVDGISSFDLRSSGQIDGCDPNGCRRTFSPAIPTNIAARGLALTPDGKGVYVVDANGRIYAGGTAPPLGLPAGLPTTSDIFRRIKLAPDGSGAYLMDITGRIWNTAGAPQLSPQYDLHPGEDWARDFAITEDGKGYYLLDKNNGIHAGGDAEPVSLNLPPPTTTDTGRDIELVDGRHIAIPIPDINTLPEKMYVPTALR